MKNKKKSTELLSNLIEENRNFENEKTKQRCFIEKKYIFHDDEPIKERITFSFSLYLVEKLDNSWMTLRVNLKNKNRITKTLIAETALQIALQDLDENGQESLIYKTLSSI